MKNVVIKEKSTGFERTVDINIYNMLKKSHMANEFSLVSQDFPELKVDKKDDLTKIEGVGAKIAVHLSKNGVSTFKELSQKTEEELVDMLGKKYRTHKPATWAKQAEMASFEKWDELKKWQDKLNGGK